VEPRKEEEEEEEEAGNIRYHIIRAFKVQNL
jgi:hypothetical protein